MHEHDEHARERIRVDLHVHGAADPVMAAIATLSERVDQLGVKLMAALDALQTAVTAEDTAIDAAIVLLNGLAQQIKDLQPNQAAIDALAADISAKTAALSAAVTANTPTPPAQPSVPVETPT